MEEICPIDLFGKNPHVPMISSSVRYRRAAFHWVIHILGCPFAILSRNSSRARESVRILYMSTSSTPPAPLDVVSTRNADHYTWGERCDGWHLVQNQELSVIQERMPPGTQEVPHWHTTAQQFFLVLTGTLSVDLSGVLRQLTDGDGILVPAGTPHTVMNVSDEPVEFIVVSQPPSHGDRMTLYDLSLGPS